MSEDKNPALKQSLQSLSLAANMAGTSVGPSAAPVGPRRSTLAAMSKGVEKNGRRTPPPMTCQQRLQLSFYFDGTGNNRDADIPTYEHSNVARMYLARKDDSPEQGIYSFYIPGLGTYFMEIGDPGSSLGMAFGAKGEDRLQWALKKLQERRAAAPKLCSIDIALFGFSRGAALARAFANRVQKLCAAGSTGGAMVLKGTQIGVRIYFMGLWDTVASTGLPKSANNQSTGELVKEQAWTSIGGSAFSPERRMRDRDVRDIAYGKPGADPSPSTWTSYADGHMDWGGEMAIPPIVTAGVHMMAGHEIRNSFPVDTTMKGKVISPSFAGQEYIYPGAHSNIGGGYRPGEGGRSWKKGQQLSLITLRVMYEKAVAEGVPLNDLNDTEAVSAGIRLYFAQAVASDPEANHAAAAEYDKLLTLWNGYMNYCGRGTRPLGEWFLAHMKAYYAWRFWHIRESRSARESNQPTRDEQSVGPLEKSSKQEQADLERQIAEQDKSATVRKARENTASARAALATARQRQFQDFDNMGGSTGTASATEQAEARAQIVAAEARLKAAKEAQDLAEDPMRRLEARKATLPSQGTLGRNLRQYDDRLYADAAMLARDKGSRGRLRPYYRALVQAWEDEFLNNKGLIDANVMKFFDNYVHDSLADFNHDATLPSDPRVVYIGGDELEAYALNFPPVAARDVQAA